MQVSPVNSSNFKMQRYNSNINYFNNNYLNKDTVSFSGSNVVNKENKDNFDLDNIDDTDAYIDYLKNNDKSVVKRVNSDNENVMHLLDGNGRKRVLEMFPFSEKTDLDNKNLVNNLLLSRNKYGETPLSIGRYSDTKDMFVLALTNPSLQDVFNKPANDGIRPQDLLTEDDKIDLLTTVKDDKNALRALANLKYLNYADEETPFTTLFNDTPGYNTMLVESLKDDKKQLWNLLTFSPNENHGFSPKSFINDRLFNIPKKSNQTFLHKADSETIDGVLGAVQKIDPEMVSELLLKGPSVIYSSNDEKLDVILKYVDYDNNYLISKLFFNKYVMNKQLFGKTADFGPNAYGNPYTDNKANSILKVIEKYPEKLVDYICEDENYSRVKSPEFTEFLFQTIQGSKELIKQVFNKHPELISRRPEFPLINALAIMEKGAKFLFSNKEVNEMIEDIKSIVMYSDEVSKNDKIKLLNVYFNSLSDFDNSKTTSKEMNALYQELTRL